MNFAGTIFSLLPAVLAIGLALITKEVYLSLFLGIFVGALLVSGFSPLGTLLEIFDTMIGCIADKSNIGILLFLVFLGIIVALMSKGGGSKAYGELVSKFIKTRKGIMTSIFGLGCLIFVDDYFNCLTVGSVMRDVSDKFKISRAKLAYIIDATAAPVCIIAPISSWAAAVTGYTSGDGFALFLQTIPLNLYALLTIIMILVIIWFNIDFGKMRENEIAAINGDVYNGYYKEINKEEILDANPNGKVIDLVLPVAFLIMACIVAMIYTGGFFDGVPFMEAFRYCDASYALVLGSFVSLVFIFVLYIPRKIVSYDEFTACIPHGFKLMVSAMIILVLAWTLGEMVSVKLNAGAFVSTLIKNANFPLFIIPAVIFVLAIGLSFSTGTSWGTFAVLIPIVTSVFGESDPMLVISIASILAGSVCGDHISPISDTTIMASAGAQCNHINHVSTQMPYALVVAVASFIGYVVAGITQNTILTFIVALVVMLAILFGIKFTQKKA